MAVLLALVVGLVVGAFFPNHIRPLATRFFNKVMGNGS